MTATTVPMLLAAAGIGIGHAVLPDHWMPLAVLARTRRYPARRVLRLSLAAAVTHVLVSLLAGAVLITVGMRFRDTVTRHTDLAVGGVLLATGLMLLVLEAFGRGHAHPHPHGHGHHAHDSDEHGGHDHAQAGHEHHGHGYEHHSHEHHSHEHHSHEHHSHGHHDHGHEHPHPHAAVTPSLVVPAPTQAVAVLEPSATAPAPPLAPARPRRNLLAFLVPFGAAASPDLTILPLFLAAGTLGVTPAVGVLAAFAATTIAAIVGLTMATTLGTARLTAPWIEKRANALTAATLVVIGGLVVADII